MQVAAKLKYARISPQKCRLIADMVRGKPVGLALNTLKYTPKKGARLVLKVLESAVANAENNLSADVDELKVQTVTVDTAPVLHYGPLLQRSRHFPESVNVGFAEVVARDRVRLRVYERGVGETLACGTGACAAAATGILAGALDARVRIDLPGGTLIVRWEGPGTRLWLEGPAEVSFNGRFELHENSATQKQDP